MKNNQLTHCYCLSDHKSQLSVLFQDLSKTWAIVCRSPPRVSKNTVNQDEKEISDGGVISGKLEGVSKIRRKRKVRMRAFFEAVRLKKFDDVVL